MTRRFLRLIRRFASLLLLLSGSAQAEQLLRVQVNQHGDFALIGNTLAQDCAPGLPPAGGTVLYCGVNTDDSAPDVFWRADYSSPGSAVASAAFHAADARTTAMLKLPAGAQITHAYLYWAATLASGATAGGSTATLTSPDGSSADLTAVDVQFDPVTLDYRSVADVTALVQAQGVGAYRISGVASKELVDLSSETAYAAWWMIVFYQLDTDPLRNLTLYDGLSHVEAGVPQNVNLSGFLVPLGGYTAKLGVVALEGDVLITGDQLSFNGAVLSNAVNPSNNFFNGTHSAFGVPVSVFGDQPKQSGTPGSMSGIDMDIVDITAQVTSGQTSAPISATSTGDFYDLATFVVSISTFAPALGKSSMSVADLNGGVVLPGDTLEYTVDVVNDGNDSAVLTTLVDALPAGVTFVPGSIEILSGANAGLQSDAANDDEAEYVADTNSIVVRLGAGAGAAQGGQLNVGETTSLRFDVVVDALCSGQREIANQAVISASGQAGAATMEFATDGNGADAGNPPTRVGIDVRCLTVALDGSGSGTVTSDPAGIDCGSACAAAIATGGNVMLTATPANGSIFVGWSGTASPTDNPLAVMMDADATVTATFDSDVIFADAFE